jgi:hypothetical protein
MKKEAVIREFFESIKKESGFIDELYDIPEFIKNIRDEIGMESFNNIELDYRDLPDFMKSKLRK